MNYPTMQQVNAAAREQICAWYRYLKHPETNDQVQIISRIAVRFKEMGGFTPEISKRIDRLLGLNEPEPRHPKKTERIPKKQIRTRSGE